MSTPRKAPQPHLEPCPFCGRTPYVVEDGHSATSRFLLYHPMQNSGSRRCAIFRNLIGEFTTEQGAAISWNKRTATKGPKP